MKLLKITVAAVAIATLSACASIQTAGSDADEAAVAKKAGKAHYSEFTDSTWMPESQLRAPYGAQRLSLSTAQSFINGMYYLDDKYESSLRLTRKDNAFEVAQKIPAGADSVINFGTGSETVYRNGRPYSILQMAKNAEQLDSRRVMFHGVGQTQVNLAVEARAYDVSGQPIRHFLRDAHNQPTDLAYYTSKDATFPSGSIVYQLIYWLGDDEIIRPSASAFTGADTFANMRKRFSTTTPFCVSFVPYSDSTAYGVLFAPDPKIEPAKPAKNVKTKGKSRGKKPAAAAPAPAITSGQFRLVTVRDDTMLCERKNQTGYDGKWTLQTVRGTSVMALENSNKVNIADIGIQPIHRDAVKIGFAEIITSAPKDKKIATSVIPVRIIKNNEALADFRLRYNKTAADAVRAALKTARAHRQQATK